MTTAAPKHWTDADDEAQDEMRSEEQISALEDELSKRRWYARSVREAPGEVLVLIPGQEELSPELRQEDEAEFEASQQEVVAQYPDVVLGHDYYSWGYLSGYNAALRWVLGGERHNGDT